MLDVGICYNGIYRGYSPVLYDRVLRESRRSEVVGKEVIGFDEPGVTVGRTAGMTGRSGDAIDEARKVDCCGCG